MSHWELGPPLEPPILSPEQAIEIALSDPMTSPDLRGFPVEATYGVPLRMGFQGKPPGTGPDAWRVAVDVSTLGWEMAYEGPGPTVHDGVMLSPVHVRVPKVRAVIILVDDKMGRRMVSGTEPEPDQEHRIEWRRATSAMRPPL